MPDTTSSSCRRKFPTVAILHGGEHSLDQPTEPPDEDEYDEDEGPDPDDEYERRLERNGYRNW